MSGSKIVCLGDSTEVLVYKLGPQKWDKLRLDNTSSYTGALRFMAGIATHEGRIIICGGCLVSSGDATNATYEFTS